MSSTAQILDRSVGYGILIGVGALFAFLIVLIVKVSKRYLGDDEQSTENFLIANREVGVGLTGSAVLSSWMWATVIIWAPQMVYLYGIGAGLLYATSSTFEIAILCVIAAESKQKIPNAHTSLEIIQRRYGNVAHILYIFLCLVNNLLSCSAMILGAASVFITLTDIHPVAANLLIPFGVLVYTAVGGLRATFYTDYLHTVIALIIFAYFATAGVTIDKVGSIGKLYDMVVDYQESSGYYIKGNYKGSLLTLKSPGAWYFYVIHNVGDLGLSVMDSSFWQKAYSADVTATVPGYIIGSLGIFALSFPIGTIWGLLNVVFEHTPEFPLYPNGMTTEDINNANGILYTLYALLGKGAVGAVLLAVYLAATSTVSAQTISVSSIISFDIYRAYINPEAKNKQLIRTSHAGVIFFGLFSAGFSVMLHYVGISVTWLGYFYPMIICVGVIPLLLSITWSGQSKMAVIISPIIGIGASFGVWLGVTKSMYGSVSVDTTINQLPCLYGGITALFLPGILSVIISLVRPQKFDWQELQKVELVQEDDSDFSEKEESSETTPSSINENEKENSKRGIDTVNEITDDIEHQPSQEIYRNGLTKEEYDAKAKQYVRYAWIYAIVNIIVTQILWTVPLYRDYIFTKTFFKGWVTFSIMTIYFSFMAVGVYPLWDGRESLIIVFKGILKDLRSIGSRSK